MANKTNPYDPRQDLDQTTVYRGGLVRDGGQSAPGQQPGYGYDPNGYDGPYAAQGQEPGSADGGYDDGYDGYDGYDGGDYDDYGDYGDYDGYAEGPSRTQGMSMAARAAGKANPDPYSRRSAPEPARRPAQSNRRPTQERRSTRGYDDRRPPARRRKKRHGFRNFLIFLLILAGLLGAGYYALFRAPERYQDGVHTRRPGVYNILLCATDEGELRTDTMMLATLDQKNSQISLTTLPRDSIVDNGEWVPKLNGVYGLYGGGEAGAQALMDAVDSLLGFRPDGYAIINYTAFRDAVDALGGVTFDVPMDMSVDGMDFTAGEQRLNGEQALAVCRFRYGYLMADIQRQYVQQNFVKAMVQECKSPSNWPKLPAVYRAVMNNTLTDLSDANIRYLALHAYLAGLDDIQQNTLPGEGVDYNGSSCFGLYGQSVVDLVNQVMNPFQEELTIDDVDILTVEDGELVPSTWRGEAFDPSTYDYNSY